MEKISSEWAALEKFVGQNVPMFLKVLLWKTGYDSLLSIKQITTDTIKELEQFMQRKKNEILPKIFTELNNFGNKDYSLSEYEDQEVFEFLPGHRTILMSFRSNIEGMQLKGVDQFKEDATHSSNKLMENEKYSVILREFIKTADQNYNKSKYANQYNDIVKFFSTYIFLLCGRVCYETLNKNLPIPSTKTILRCINDTKERIVEGELRSKGLAEYLIQHNAGCDVWLCEDGSGLVPKISYDATSDELIGMALPIDDKTGCPKKFEFTTRDEAEIKRFCAMNKSTHVYLVLAIPLKEGIAPYILQIFGTDNRFTAQNVVQRWNYTNNELRRCGIKVRGYSSDGDPRLLAAMRNQMCCGENEICYMQDAIHGGLKLRTCFLRTYAALPMGTKLASSAHLKVLIREVPKSIHGLVLSDVSPVDKQNFKSLQKCMSIRTREALHNYVPDSEATEFFLKLCFEITSSLMDHHITPYERIEMLYHAIFFLRIWRKWILKSKFVLKENFITSNAYLCAELNGTNLLKLIRLFRNENKPELFITTLFDSQACERAFRQFRSMGTPNFTRINFCFLELLHMVRRIEVQNEIVYSKLPEDIDLPKLKKKRETTTIFALPTEEEIEECLCRAKRFALSDASQFGMLINADEIDKCEISMPKKLETTDKTSSRTNDEEEDEIENELQRQNCEDRDESIEDFLILEAEEENQSRALIAVTDHLGMKKMIKKSELVWQLSEGTKKISSDRLVRVQEKCDAVNASSSNISCAEKRIYVSDQIKLGDWCAFKNIEVDGGETIQFGLLHAFKYTNRSNVKEKSYNFHVVNFLEKPNLAKELDVLSTWYLLNDQGALTPAMAENHYFIRIERYVGTLSVCPSVDPDTRRLFFNENDFKALKDDTLTIIG